jgi:hypothetical protein
MKWDAKLVEELLKRLDHQLTLSYDTKAKDLLLQSLEKYNNSELAADSQGLDRLVNNLYQNPVLKNIVAEASLDNKAELETPIRLKP